MENWIFISCLLLQAGRKAIRQVNVPGHSEDPKTDKERNLSMKKRLVAFMLVLTMCWSSTVNFSSGAFTAYAETPEKEFEESSPAGEEEGEGLPENPAGETQGLPEANPSPESAGGSDPEKIPGTSLPKAGRPGKTRRRLRREQIPEKNPRKAGTLGINPQRTMKRKKSPPGIRIRKAL